MKRNQRKQYSVIITATPRLPHFSGSSRITLPLIAAVAPSFGPLRRCTTKLISENDLICHGILRYKPEALILSRAPSRPKASCSISTPQNRAGNEWDKRESLRRSRLLTSLG